MPGKAETVLILGGTKEAAALAAELAAAHPHWRVITSLAGRTREPKPLAGEMCIGGFGGAEGLADYLRREKVTQLIDATHPFARRISASAVTASKLTGVPLDIRARAPWQKQPGDNWREAGSLEEASEAVPAGARVLLALGSQHIEAFVSRSDAHFVVRMIDAPKSPLPLAAHELVFGAPGDEAEETALLTRCGITHVVCRNSGGHGAYAKIAAARALKLPVIMIMRPAE